MRLLPCLMLSVFILVSCNRNGVIPEKDMVAIIAKIQLIDASVQNHLYNKALLNKDTIDYYSKTIQSFGYSKEQFDSSLSYYSREPKALDLIYDKVIIELSAIETSLSASVLGKADSTSRDTSKNLWNLKERVEFPKEDSLGTVDFSILVKGIGVYTITASVCVSEDDLTLKPSMEAYFFFDDKSKEGNRSAFTTKPYTKGKDTLAYSLQLDLKNSLVTHIKGSLFAHSNSKQTIARHATITKIRVTFKQNSTSRIKNRDRINRERRREQLESN